MTGEATTSSPPRVTCLVTRDRVGDAYEVVAPVAGTYRFELTSPAGTAGYALALRARCGGPEDDDELACAADAAPGARCSSARWRRASACWSWRPRAGRCATGSR